MEWRVWGPDCPIRASLYYSRSWGLEGRQAVSLSFSSTFWTFPCPQPMSADVKICRYKSRLCVQRGFFSEAGWGLQHHYSFGSCHFGFSLPESRSQNLIEVLRPLFCPLNGFRRKKTFTKRCFTFPPIYIIKIQLPCFFRNQKSIFEYRSKMRSGLKTLIENFLSRPLDLASLTKTWQTSKPLNPEKNLKSPKNFHKSLTGDSCVNTKIEFKLAAAKGF